LRKVFAYLKKGCIRCIIFCLVLSTAAPCLAGQPTEQIRETTDKIIAIVTDPALKPPEKAEEKKVRIREVVNERFDWREISRRTLARKWKRRTEKEKAEFVRLFGRLLERTYLAQVEGYSGEKVLYLKEALYKGGFAEVEVKIVNKQGTEIPVTYKLRKRGDKWLVYDISIEGRSLVNNYRKQFQRMSYRRLIKQLKAKVAQKT